jgi:hypothetical protein
MGEHDYYLDLGEHWSRLFGPHHYSFDRGGVHFVVLNSILTHDDWTHGRWPGGERRMLAMAGLDNPDGSPFLVGEAQRAWLARDLAGIARDTPLVVFSHSPLQKIHRNWNFWTEDAEAVQALLRPFAKVNVVHGHLHRIRYAQVGNIAFQSGMATAWPWPSPAADARAGRRLPVLTVSLDHGAPLFENDATGWQFVDLRSGRVDLAYNLFAKCRRVATAGPKPGCPGGAVREAAADRIAPWPQV